MLVEFRKENQRIEDRREFDINDPDSKLKGKPARVSDDDPRLTVSGLQAFDGEDLEYERRKKLQQKQLRYVLTLFSGKSHYLEEQPPNLPLGSQHNY